MRPALNIARVNLACASALTLAACGQPQPIRILPPASLASCAAEPEAPALPDRTEQAERDRLVLEYLLSLRSAGADCRAKVNGLATWMKEPAR